MTFLKRLALIISPVLFFALVTRLFSSRCDAAALPLISNPAVCPGSACTITTSNVQQPQTFTCGENCFLLALAPDQAGTNAQHIRLWSISNTSLCSIQEINVPGSTNADVIGPIGHLICGDACFIYAVVAGLCGYEELRLWHITSDTAQQIALINELPIVTNSHDHIDTLTTLPVSKFKQIGLFPCHHDCLLYVIAQVDVINEDGKTAHERRCKSIEVMHAWKISSTPYQTATLETIDQKLMRKMMKSDLHGWHIVSHDHVGHVKNDLGESCLFFVRHLRHHDDKKITRDEIVVLNCDREGRKTLHTLFGNDHPATHISQLGGFASTDSCSLYVVSTTLDDLCSDDSGRTYQSTLSLVSCSSSCPQFTSIKSVTHATFDPSCIPLREVGVAQTSPDCNLIYLHYVQQSCTDDETETLSVVRFAPRTLCECGLVVPVGHIDGVERSILAFQDVGIKYCSGRSFLHAVTILNDDSHKLMVWEFDIDGTSRNVLTLPLAPHTQTPPELYIITCTYHCVLITRTEDPSIRSTVRAWDITDQQPIQELSRFFLQHGTLWAAPICCSPGCRLAVQQYHQINLYDLEQFLDDPSCLNTEQVSYLPIPPFDNLPDLITYINTHFPGSFDDFLQQLCSGSFTIPLETLILLVESGALSYNDLFCVLRLINPSDPCHRLYHYPEDRLVPLLISYAQTLTDQTCWATQLPFDLLLPLQVAGTLCNPEYQLSCKQRAALLDAWIPTSLPEIELAGLVPWIQDFLTERGADCNRWYSCDTQVSEDRTAVLDIIRTLLSMGPLYPSSFYADFLTGLNPDGSSPITITTPFMLGLLDPLFNDLFDRSSSGALVVALYARWASHQSPGERFDLCNQLHELIFGLYQTLTHHGEGTVLSLEQTLAITTLGIQQAQRLHHAVNPEIIIRILLRVAHARKAATDLYGQPTCSTLFLSFAQTLIRSLTNFDQNNCEQQRVWDQFWQGPVGSTLKQASHLLENSETHIFKPWCSDTPCDLFAAQGSTRSMGHDHELALSFRNHNGVICLGIYPAQDHDNGVNWYNGCHQTLCIDKGILCFEISLAGSCNTPPLLPPIYKINVSCGNTPTGILHHACQQLGNERGALLLSLLKDKACCNATFDTCSPLGSFAPCVPVNSKIEGSLVIQDDHCTDHLVTIEGTCVTRQSNDPQVCSDMTCNTSCCNVHITEKEQQNACMLIKGWCWFDPQKDMLAIPAHNAHSLSTKLQFTTNIQQISDHCCLEQWCPTVFVSDRPCMLTPSMTENDFRKTGNFFVMVDQIKDPCVHELICKDSSFLRLYLGQLEDVHALENMRIEAASFAATYEHNVCHNKTGVVT